MPAEPMELEFEVGEAKDEKQLLKIVISLKGDKVTDGFNEAQLAIHLRQSLPLQTQLQLIQQAQQALRQAETSLLTGNTGGLKKGPAIKA